MSRIVNQISSTTSETEDKIINVLKRYFSDLSMHPKEDMAAELAPIFEYLNSENKSDSNSDYLKRLLIAIGTIFSFPKPEWMGEIPLYSYDPYVLCNLLHFHALKCDHTNYIEEYFEYNLKILNDIKSTKTTDFYYMGLAHFTYPVIEVLKEFKDEEKVGRLISAITDMISNFSAENITMSNLIYINDILIPIWHLAIQCGAASQGNTTFEFIKELTNDLGVILDACSNYPSAFFLTIFYPWFYIMKQMPEKFLAENSEFSLKRVCESQIDIVTKMAEKVVANKHHELHSQFNWYLLFHFYWFTKDPQAKARLLILISQGMKSVKQIENFRRVCQTVDNFNLSLIERYKNDDAWSLFFTIENLHSQLLYIIQPVTEINGIIYNPNLPPEKEGTIQNSKFGFEYQRYNDFADRIVDKTMYTFISEKATSSKETAIKWFNEELRIIKNSKDSIISIIPFHSKFTRFITSEVLKEKKDKSGIYYFLKTANIWTEQAIIYSHKFCMLKKFEQCNLLFDKRDYTNSVTTTELGILINGFQDYIHREFIKTILSTPEYYINDVTSEMASVIINYIEEDMITSDFFDVFEGIRKEEAFLTGIVNSLYSYVTENIKLMLSDNRHEANIIPKVLRFIVRFCRIPVKDRDGKYYPILLKILKTYQRLIVTSVSQNTKRTLNQTDTFNVILTDALIFSYLTEEATGSKPNDMLFVRIKPLVFNDFMESNKYSSLRAFFEMIALDAENLEFVHCLDIFKAAFESCDSELISKAAIIFTEIFLNEIKRGKMSVNENVLLPVYQALFSNMHIMSKQAVMEVQKIIPYIPQIYTQQSTQEFPSCNIEFGSTGVDILYIIHNIIRNYEDTEQNAIVAFQIVSQSMEMVRNRITEGENLNILFNEMLSLLLKCCVYSHLTNIIDEYSSHLALMWGNVMADGISNQFFLECVTISATLRSHVSYRLYLLANSILNYIKTRDHSTVMIKKTLEDIMSKKGFNRSHIIIIGLSLYESSFPEYITRDDINELFYEATIIQHNDIDLPGSVNKFLKKYLSRLDEEGKRNFVDDALKILSSMLTPFRHIITKRIRKLGITFPPEMLSTAAISTSNPIDYQILPLKLAMGTTVTPEVIEKVTQMITLQLEKLSLSEKLSRKSSLITELMHTDDLFKTLATYPQLTSQILNFLCTTLICRFNVYKKLANKKFRVLKNSSMCSSHIDDNCNKPEKIFTFFGNQRDSHVRIKFYRKLVKLNADRVNPRIFKDFIQKFIEYTDFSESDKMKNLCNFEEIVKIFTIQEYIKRDSVKKCLFEPYLQTNMTNFEKMADASIELFSVKTMPNRAIFLKHLNKFFSLFPAKFIGFLFSPKCVDPMNAFRILSDFIILGENDSLFLTLTDFVLTNKNYSKLHPSAVQIFHTLANYEKFLMTEELPKVVMNMFGDILIEFSKHNFNDANMFTNLEIIAETYIKIIGYNPTFENVIDFAKVFSNPMFYHTNIYKNFINVAFFKIPEYFSSSLLDYIINNHFPLLDVQFYILVSHAIIHCGDCDDDLIERVWETIFMRIETEKTLCSSLKCAISLLKRWKPTPNNAKKLTEAIIKGITSGDCQTELYSLKACMLLMNYEDMFFVPLFYKIAIIILSYNKYTDEPYKKLVFKFFNSKLEYYDNPPKEFISALQYFVHNKLSSTIEAITMLSLFVHVPILMKFLPFSIITSYILFLKNRIEKHNGNLKEVEFIEYSGLINKGLDFIKETKPSKEEVDYFMKASMEFIYKFIEANVHVEEDRVKVICRIFRYINSTVPEYFSPHVLDLITVKNFNINTFSIIACACSLHVEELKKHTALIQKAFLYMRQYFFLNLDEINNILNYVINAKNAELNQSLKECFEWFLQNFNESNRDQFIRIMKAFILINTPDERVKVLHRIWDSIIEVKSKIATFRCTCLKLYTLFCIESIKFLPVQGQVDFAEYIFKMIENKPNEQVYVVSAAASVFRSKDISEAAKIVFLNNLPYNVSREVECYLSELVQESKKFEQTICDKGCVDKTIFLLVSSANVLFPKAKISLIKYILKLLPDDPVKRLEHLMLSVSPEIWNDLYLPLICLIASPQTPEVISLYSFASSLQKIGKFMLTELLLRYFDGSPAERAQSIIEFTERVNFQNSRRMHGNAIAAVTNVIIQRDIKLQTINLVKVAHLCGMTNAVVIDNPQIDIPIHTLETVLPFDNYYAAVAPHLSPMHRAATALTLLSKYDIAQKIYQLQITSDIPFFNLMRRHNNHMFITEGTKENKEFGFNCLIRTGYQTEQICKLIIYNSMSPSSQATNKAKFEDMMNSLTVHMRNVSDRTPAARERIATALLSHKISEEMNQRKRFSVGAANIKASINPSYYQSMVISMKHGITKKNQVVEEDPLFLVTPRNACCTNIAGYHPSGLIALSHTSVREIFALMEDKSKKEMQNWQKFATVCFNVYVNAKNFLKEDPSTEGEVISLFKTVFLLYSGIICNSNDITLDKKYEVASRLIVLINDGLKIINSNEFSLAIRKSTIFAKSRNDVWHLVLPKLIRLCEDPIICECSQEILEENITEILSMSDDLGLTKAKEVVLRLEGSNKQKEAVDGIKGIFDSLFEMNILEYMRQRKASDFLHQLRFTSDEELEEVNFENIAAKNPRTQLEVAICESRITSNSFNALKVVRNMAIEEKNLSELAKTLTNAEESFEDIEAKIVSCVEKFNIFHHKIPNNEADFLMALNNIKWISESQLQFTVLKGKGGTTSTLVLQKLSDISGQDYERNMFLTYISPLFNYLFGTNYFLHTKGIQFTTFANKTKFFGHYSITRCPEHINSLRRVYELHFHEEPSDSHSESSSNEILLRQVVSGVKKFKFLRNKASFTANMGAAAARNIICGTRFPHLNEFIISIDNGNIVPTFVIQGSESVSTFRSSPNIMRIAGPNDEYRNQMVLSLSSSMEAALVNGYDSICAVEELLNTTEDPDSLIQSVTARKELLDSLLRFVPPCSSPATPKEALEWITEVEELIDDSIDPTTKPQEAFPWF